MNENIERINGTGPEYVTAMIGNSHIKPHTLWVFSFRLVTPSKQLMPSHICSFITCHTDRSRPFVDVGNIGTLCTLRQRWFVTRALGTQCRISPSFARVLPFRIHLVSLRQKHSALMRSCKSAFSSYINLLKWGFFLLCGNGLTSHRRSFTVNVYMWQSKINGRKPKMLACSERSVKM